MEELTNNKEVGSLQEQEAQEVKRLVKVILDSQTKLETMPREALVTAAWQGVANYHREGTIWGFDTPESTQREAEKDLRLSLLDDEERERAITLANDWLDENFSQ